MKVNVKLFGPQAQLAGQSAVAIDLPAGRATADDVLGALGVACPALVPSLPKSRLAVDFEIVDPASQIGASQEVALIGMLGGG